MLILYGLLSHHVVGSVFIIIIIIIIIIIKIANNLRHERVAVCKTLATHDPQQVI